MRDFRQFQETKRPFLFGVLLMCILTASLCSQVLARGSKNTTASLFIGVCNWENGSTAVFGPRIDYSFLRFLGVQLAVPISSYKSGSSDRHTYIMPELSLLVSPRIGRVSPYLGLGPGMVCKADDLGDGLLSIHAALGIRVMLSDCWDVRSEARA